MRAIQLTAFGPPDALVFTEVPDPVPGPGQVLVRVAAVSVPFIDVRVRAGRGPTPAHRPQLPYVPGTSVGGEIISGEGEGQTVVGRLPSGGYAELAAVDTTALLRVPEGLPVTTAMAVQGDGRTALLVADAAKSAPGEWVLVEAAGGGVGSLLVQLAKTAGARVVGVARGKAKLELAAAVGADLTVDYGQDDWTDEVRAQTGGVDLVFDGIGGKIGTQALSLVRPGGRFLMHGMASETPTDVPSDTDVSIIGFGSIQTSAEHLHELARKALAEAAAGRLRPTVGQTFPLARAADAHRAIENRTTLGRTLLIP
ncbi:zinc-binding dehydrogenase [Fodinicola acaciae]|uniref:zinc-binding dehydrogenase n=1 Tax=Fodinicola acaciae TaxID=2681555 RepID=UPI0013D47F52|nr:zinc-binding dehydrogenase [Fodinicola acaciae]